MAGTFNPNDMELTPAIIYYTPAGSTTNYDLGGSLGNIKIGFSFEKADIKADQTGSTPLDKRVSGVKVTVATEITQVNDFQLFNILFPNSQLVGSAPYNGSSPSAAVQWNNTVGNSDIAVAGVLTLHPQYIPSANINHDWTFFKAVATEVTELTYGPTEQARFKVEWTVYPDTSVSPYRFFRFGNKNF